MDLEIRKLEKKEDYLQAEWLLATAFLNNWDEEEAREKAVHPQGDIWAAFDKTGRMVSAISTLRHELFYEGDVISCGELHMVGSLPEVREAGAVRALIGQILRDYKERGDFFATLLPFSFAFYRKFGFEAASEMLVQKAAIDQFAGFCQEYEARQILCQEDVDQARALWHHFIGNYNLADLRDRQAWTYGDGGEFGSRDWQHMDKQPYSYIFHDQAAKARAYFSFIFIPGPRGPFTGTMKVTDLAFDSPQALRSIFAFIYGMRAKIRQVQMSLPADVDLSLMLPEPDLMERELDSHYTARALNIEKILAAMSQPGERGSYSLHITDSFLPDNTGTYRVTFAQGKTESVQKGEGPADLALTVETFCQLAVGLIGLEAALYREGTLLKSKRELLKKVFRKRPVLLD